MTTKDWLDLVKNKPVAFGIETGFKDLTDIHNDWLKSFLLSKDDYTLQSHRGSYKTTCISIALALMIIIYPDKSLMFMRKTDDDVKEIISQVSHLLKQNIFQDLAYGLYNKKLELVKQSVFEIETNLKFSPRGTTQLVGVGSKGSLTGKHFDVIVTDDIINLQDRISPAERERTKLTYQELQNIKNRGGRLINCGTPWHKEDAFILMNNINKFDCYSTGLINKEQLAGLREAMTPSLFSANYELKHIADEDALFGSPKFYNLENKADLYNGIAHIDAAYGGSDYTALTIIKEHEGKLLAFGKMWDKHVDDCLNEILLYHNDLKAGTIYCETNADKGYLIKRILEKGIPCKGYPEKTNKFIKISSQVKPNWDRLLFLDNTDREYINQILDYTEYAKHDDAPDSLASAIRIITNKRNDVDYSEQISALKYMGL